MKDNFQKQFKNIVYVILGIMLLIVLWEVVSFATDHLFLPEFFMCLGKTFSLFGNAFVMVSLGYTILRMLISVLISSLLAIVLGILAGYYDSLAHILFPLITILRTIPTIALVLLLIVYVPNFSYYVVSLVVFPIIYEAVLEGSRNVYSKYENDFLLIGKHHINNITRVVFPLSTGYIFLGLIQGVGLGLKVEIMAEILAQNSRFRGLGPLIQQAYIDVDYLRMMAYVMFVLFLAFIFDAMLRWVSKIVTKHYGISSVKKNMFSH